MSTNNGSYRSICRDFNFCKLVGYVAPHIMILCSRKNITSMMTLQLSTERKRKLVRLRKVGYSNLIKVSYFEKKKLHMLNIYSCTHLKSSFLRKPTSKTRRCRCRKPDGVGSSLSTRLFGRIPDSIQVELRVACISCNTSDSRRFINSILR